MSSVLYGFSRICQLCFTIKKRRFPASVCQKRRQSIVGGKEDRVKGTQEGFLSRAISPPYPKGISSPLRGSGTATDFGPKGRNLVPRQQCCRGTQEGFLSRAISPPYPGGISSPLRGAGKPAAHRSMQKELRRPGSRCMLLAETSAIPRKRVAGKSVPCYNRKKWEFGGAYADGEENETTWNGPCSCFSADFCCTQSNWIDFVALVVGIKSDLAYVLVFRRYLFRHLGWRTNC